MSSSNKKPIVISDYSSDGEPISSMINDDYEDSKYFEEEEEISTAIINDGVDRDYQIGEDIIFRKESGFLIQMMRFEKKVGRKLYCLRSDPDDTNKKDYSFLRHGTRDIETYEDHENYFYKIKVLSDIYSISLGELEGKKQKASLFYIRLSKLKLKDTGRYSTNRIINEEIGTNISDVPSFHFLSQNSIRKHISREKLGKSEFNSEGNEFENLKQICEAYKEKNRDENDFLLCDELDDEVIWAFSLAQMREVAITSKEWHIDATYKVLRNKRGLWIISTKQDITGKVFPLLFFILPNEKGETISYVLGRFKEWVGTSPESFIADCQKSIAKSISTSFVDSKFYLCIFHILRAVQKQFIALVCNQNISNEDFDVFYRIAMLAYTQSEILEEVEHLKNIL